MFKGGEPVRVPNPGGEGTVEATYVSPSEPSRKHAEYVWVRYVEGQEQGLNAKIRYSDVERA